MARIDTGFSEQCKVIVTAHCRLSFGIGMNGGWASYHGLFTQSYPCGTWKVLDSHQFFLASFKRYYPHSSGYQCCLQNSRNDGNYRLKQPSYSTIMSYNEGIQSHRLATA